MRFLVIRCVANTNTLFWFRFNVCYSATLYFVGFNMRKIQSEFNIIVIIKSNFNKLKVEGQRQPLIY